MSQTFVCKISMELQNTVFQLSRLVPDAYSSKQNVSSMHQSKGFQHVPKQNKTKHKPTTKKPKNCVHAKQLSECKFVNTHTLTLTHTYPQTC